MSAPEKTSAEVGLMSRSPERWAGMNPISVASGSIAQMSFAIKDAQHDIELLLRTNRALVEERDAALLGAKDAREKAIREAAEIAVSFDNCGVDSDPQHFIPCEISEAILALLTAPAASTEPGAADGGGA